MSVPSSSEELIQLIRKSGMVDEQKLSAYLQRRQFTRGLPADAREFAEEMVRDGVLTGFQSEQFMLGKWRGFTIGKYKLLERVGVGGMGQVFLCEHMFMKRRVAVKVLPPAKAEQPAALGRFYREARAAGGLEHPNIVRTQDIDQDGNLHFIVMDYVDGADLLAVVKKVGPLDLGRAASYIRQTAAGLDYAFRSGIIHRDIKPGNILIDRRGTARILDMGLARFFKDHSDQLTVKYDDKIVLGTADYVAPEQVANSHSVDIRADIYALGATFYFLLAGHPPFPTGTVSQKLLWHRTKEPTPIRQVRPEVPEGLAAVITRMMAKDPKARYQTPGQVVADLAAWVPEAIPAPTSEEMPQLSPAALEGANVEEAAEVTVELAASAEETLGNCGRRTAVVADPATTPVVTTTAVLAEPRPGIAPFGPSSPNGAGPFANPWAAPTNPPPPANPFKTASGQRPAIPARAPATSDTTAAVERTPPSRRSGRLAANPFSGGDVADTPAKKSPWMALAVLGVAVVVGLVIAVLKFAG